MTTQLINSVKISNTSPYSNFNNSVDTTGRINEKLSTKFNKTDIITTGSNSIPTDNNVYSSLKIDDIIKNNTYNYDVNEIIDDITTATDDIIFVVDNDVYTLYHKINDNYEIYNVPINSILLIKSTQELFILYNITTNPTIQLWKQINSIDTTQTLLLKNSEDSLQTIGNIKIGGTINETTGNYENEQIELNKEGKITSNDIICNNSLRTGEITVGQITAMYRNMVNYKPLFYGVSNTGIYLISEDKSHINFIHNQSLEVQDIIIDIGTNIYYIVAAYMYNNYLNLLLMYQLTEESPRQSKLIVFNETTMIYSYTNILTEEQKQTISNDSFTITCNMGNNTDIYFIHKDIVFLFFYTNKVPTELITLLDFSMTYQTSETIHKLHNVGQYIYILCDTYFYKYSINNNTIQRIYYNFDDTILNHTYDYSICDNNVIYIKYANINSIYYLDDTQTTNIIKFTNNNHLDDFNICHFNIVSGVLYFLNEEFNDPYYEYTFYKYGLSNNNIAYIYKINAYHQTNKYNSIIELIQVNNIVVLLDSSNNYINCKITFPLMEIAYSNSYIKNFMINNNNIVMASNNVVVTGDNVSNKVVTKNIILKDHDDLYLTNIGHKIQYGMLKHYYQTTRGMFFYTTEANCTHLDAIAIPSFETKQLKVVGTGEFIQSTFVYNNQIYILFSNTTDLTIYFRIYDIIKRSNGSTLISVMTENMLIENDTTNPFITNKYFYDTNIVIDNILYIYNSASKNLYSCDLTASTLQFTFIKQFTTLQSTVIPSSPVNNKNYSNTEHIFNLNGMLLFIYYTENNNTRIYNIYTYELTTQIEYNIEIYRNTYNDISLLHYGVLNEEVLYLNILDQNANLRGIFYINDFRQSDTPKQLKLYPMFSDNGYSFYMYQNKFYVITTQDFFDPGSGQPQKYTYYINYYDKVENVLQTTKYVEKMGYSKFGLEVPPLLLNNVEIFMVDSNNVYNLYTASMFSHMFSSERSIINNNAVFNTDSAFLYNNLYVSTDKCRILSVPASGTDVVNKSYVDDIKNNISSVKLEIATNYNEEDFS